MPPDKQLASRCRNLLREYQDVIDIVVAKVVEEINREQVVGNTSFEYAKKVIRKEGMKEGIKLFLNKLNNHAAER